MHRADYTVFPYMLCTLCVKNENHHPDFIFNQNRNKIQLKLCQMKLEIEPNVFDSTCDLYIVWS